MSENPKTTLMCCLCGDFFEKGPDLCSINFHKFEELKLNTKGNGYTGSKLQGGACLQCLSKYLEASSLHPDKCAFCHKKIKAVSKLIAIKLAVYIYRKRGCSGIIGFHNSCFRKIKSKNFLFSRLLL